MWPLAASGGWPPARGYLHSESVNAQRMRPYMPGPLARGTTVCRKTAVSVLRDGHRLGIHCAG